MTDLSPKEVFDSWKNDFVSKLDKPILLDDGVEARIDENEKAVFLAIVHGFMVGKQDMDKIVSHVEELADKGSFNLWRNEYKLGREDFDRLSFDDPKWHGLAREVMMVMHGKARVNPVSIKGINFQTSDIGMQNKLKSEAAVAQFEAVRKLFLEGAKID